MRSSDVVKAVRSGLSKAGVPKHVIGIEIEPPKVHIKVLIGGKLFELYVRSQATSSEVEAKVAELRARWQEHIGVQGVIK